MMISIDAGEDFDKVQHTFMTKKSPEKGYKGNISQHNKGIYTTSPCVT